ncbi:iron-sulfur cluster assembly scaffold protein [Sphingomonas sp. GCM10030256]|uniref:iron-sulfur cluster assembly scaffold protein n=1 Tax=Sphingomonas sp. GCM10030256 TaxID=3273427 RepID=UPI00361573A7
MNAPLYTTEILRLAASLPLASSLAAPHGRGEKRSATCGSVIRTEVLLEGSRVIELAQGVQACAFGQASAALVQHFAVGKSRAEIGAARDRLAGWLRGEGVAPVGFDVLAPAKAKVGRHGAILLPFDALIAALESSAAAPLVGEGDASG